MAGGSAVSPPIKGLSFDGLVTQVISPTVFTCTLKGYGDNFFQGWDVYVVRKGTGTGAAPQGDKVSCTNYVSRPGQFTLASIFGVPLTVGDQVYLIHPYISSNTILTVFPSNNVKQSSLLEETAITAAYVKVKELAFTGIQGGARISFELKVDNPVGTAFAVIYKNGVPVPTITAPFYPINTDVTGAYGVSKTQDVYGLKAGDLIQIYARVDIAPRIASVRNFTIGYDIVTFPSVGLALDAVYIDTINGVAGTTWPLGTPGYPVNNLSDAIIIAGYRNTSNFHVRNELVLDQDLLAPYNFFGDRDWYSSYIDLNFHDVLTSTFSKLGVYGSSPSYFVADDCFIDGILGGGIDWAQLNADLTRCAIGSIQPVPVSGIINCYDCNSVGPPYSVSLAGGGLVGWAGGSGAVNIVDADDIGSQFYLMAPGIELTVMASCIDGFVGIAIAGLVQDAALGTFVDDHWTFRPGKVNTISVHITSDADAGDVLVATATNGRIKINNVVERSNDVTTLDLTTAAVYAGVGNVLTLIDALRATLANLAVADMQEQGVGPWTLNDGGIVTVHLDGTGSDPVDLTIDIDYESLELGAHML